jgi:hypothetical protein
MLIPFSPISVWSPVVMISRSGSIAQHRMASLYRALLSGAPKVTLDRTEPERIHGCCEQKATLPQTSTYQRRLSRAPAEVRTVGIRERRLWQASPLTFPPQPALGTSSPLIADNSDDLPEPTWPTMATSFPARASKLIVFSTSSPPSAQPKSPLRMETWPRPPRGASVRRPCASGVA